MQATNQAWWTWFAGATDRSNPDVLVVPTIFAEAGSPLCVCELSSKADGKAYLVERNKQLFLFVKETELGPAS
jgi:hypothetical protein